MKLWHILVLVAAGIAYGVLEPGKLTYAFGHSTLYLLLPALLFEAAWNLQLRVVKRAWRAIFVLVVPGVLLTAVLIAGALAVVGVSFKVGLLAGAILSATDPIAVVAVFRTMRVPVLLQTIVECESLFNDAVAVALYRAVLVIVVSASVAPKDVAQVSIAAVAGTVGGVLIGVLGGYLGAAVMRNRTSDRVQMIATLLLAYGSYYAAERLGCSGIFATIVSGITLRALERRWISLDVAQEVSRFWDILVLAANAIVFFLVGAALDITIVTHDPAFVLATLAGVFVARAAVTGLLLPARYPREWLDVVRVAGLRGALSLALAIALPESLPDRHAIIAATFAVAIASIASSGFRVPRTVAATARARRHPNG